MSTESFADPIKTFYSNNPYPLEGNHYGYFRKFQYGAMKDMKPQLILDAGCGTGNLSHELARAFPESKVVGLDFSEPSIAVAKSNYIRSNIEYHVANLEESLPMAEDRKADLVYCQGVIHHLANPQVALTNIRNQMADNGKGFIWLYNPVGRRRISDVMALSQILGDNGEVSGPTIDHCLAAEATLNKSSLAKKMEYFLYKVQSYGWQDIFFSIITHYKRKFSKKEQEHYILNKMDDYMNPRAKFYTVKDALALFDEAGFEVEQVLELDELDIPSRYIASSIKEKQAMWLAKEIVYQPKGLTYVVKQKRVHTS
ncbi:hypothetical protein BB427_16235 [Pseudoalteromonas sp. BMB]|uniref:class I SAM-dependent methyltransferase n=1 Tax=Pseudoalteromonas sp. BMB TaxID=1874619 RepID=UPI00083DD180|nr:class I SAM-dependent methyltransferase [Pseudoalteromonas sp. BMB]ODB35856.1 hypothetical protein BB427_16235 [Pseudoalteromonas sp. BMB]